MRKNLLILCISGLAAAASAQMIQLTPPQTPALRIAAGKGRTVPFDFRQSAAVLRYTTDGSTPDVTSKRYTSPVAAEKPGTIRCVAFLSGFLPSEPQIVQIIPAGIKPDSVLVSPAPSPAYSAVGAPALSDDYFGTYNFQQNWLGFNDTLVQITLQQHRKTRLSKVCLGLLQMQDAWIFLPRKIEIRDEHRQLLATQILPAAGEKNGDKLEWLEIALPRKKYKQLQISMYSIAEIPAWHPGKGSKAWLFVDELRGY